MSDLDDFTFYKADANMQAILDVAQPLDGSGSLRMSRGTATASYIHGVRNTGNRAFTSARARWTTTPRATGNSQLNRYGFMFQQSQLDLTGSSGQAYAAVLRTTSTQETGAVVELVHYTAGMAAVTLLASGAGLTTMLGGRIALEVSWILDLVNLGGLQIVVKHGTLADFSDLQTTITQLITSSPLTTSVGEGPALRLSNTTTDSAYLWDSMSCVPLLVT